MTSPAVPSWTGSTTAAAAGRTNTANPYLLITQKTAVELDPAGKLWTTRATRNLTAALVRLRVDRQLEEALAHGADPLHLALVLDINENRHPLRGLGTRTSARGCRAGTAVKPAWLRR